MCPSRFNFFENRKRCTFLSQNKRKIGAFVVIVLFISLHAFTAKAVGTVSFLSKADVSKKEISYMITASDNSGICGLTLNVMYDPSEVKLINHKEGSLVSNGITKCNAEIPGKIILSYISTEPLTKSGEVLLARFEPIATNCKELNINYEVLECIDINCDGISVTPNIVTIKNPIYQKSENEISKDDNKSTSENTKSSNVDANTDEIDESYDNKGNSDLQSEKDKTNDVSQSEGISFVDKKETSTAMKSQSNPWIPILSCVGILLLILVVYIYILKIRRKKK